LLRLNVLGKAMLFRRISPELLKEFKITHNRGIMVVPAQINKKAYFKILQKIVLLLYKGFIVLS
jgi:hypothetical protein